MGKITWKQAVADYEEKKAGSNTAGSSGWTGSVTWQQAVDEYKQYDADGYKALGQQRIAQRQQKEAQRLERASVSDWMSRYNSIMQGVSEYDKQRNGGFTRDASGGFSGRIESLIADYEGIKGFAEQYGFQDSQKYLDQLKQLQTDIGQINDSFSQFDDEEEFSRYMDFLNNQDEMRTASLKDLTWNSLKRGYYNSLYGEESFKAMNREQNQKEAYEKILAGEDYQFAPRNDFAGAVSGAMEQIGQQARQFTHPRTVAAVGAAGIGAFALGQAGPQVLAPEEVITVPGAMAAAFTAGSAASNLEIEAGHAYNEMLEKGISEETARKVAWGVGGVNAGLELLQVDELLDAYKVTKASGATKTVAQKIFDELLERGVDVAKETAQEVVQEGVTITGVQAASKKDTGEYAYGFDEVKSRLKDTAKSSALTFGLMNVPAAAKNTASIAAEHRNKTDFTTPNNATPAPSNATELANNSTPELSNATAVGEKSTPGGVTEKSSAVDDKMSATEAVAKNATTTVGVSKMETVQLTPDIESFSAQFGKQAEYVRRNFLEGQDLDLREDQDVALREYEIGFQAAFMIGKAGKKEALTSENVPYLSQSQREIAYQMGMEAAAEQNAAVSKVEGSEIETAAVPGVINRAVQISTGKPVEIAKISNVDGNGGMTFRLSDGRTVEASDIQYGTESESVLYESVADLGASAEVSNKLVNTWRENPGGVSAETYAAGMMEAFNYGRYNIPETEMEQSETIQPLTATQRSTAYQLGKTHGSELVQTKEANIRRAGALAKAQKASRMAAQQTFTATSADNSRVTRTSVGKVHFDRQGRTLSAVQETGLKTMEQLSQLFGTEFHVFESYEKDGKRVFRDENGQEQAAPNGWYDPETGHIHIDLNAGSGGRGTMLFTVAHEMTHFIRDWSPAKFDKLAEAVFQLVYQEQDINVIALVREQQAKAARTGRKMSFDEAYEEVVADSMESILTSGRVVELMAEVKQQDQSLWKKIRKWFQNLAEDIRKLIEAYAGYKPDSAEGRAVAAMEEMLPVIEGFYVDALQEASANYQAAEGQKNTTHEGGDVKYSISYRDAIDQLAEGTLDRKTNTHLLVSENTPQVYIDKAGAKDQKIIMGWDIAYLAMNKSGDIPGNYHGLGKEVMKNLPEALKDPLYIVKQNNGRVAAVTEIVVKKNRSVVVSVEFDAFKSTIQDGETASDNYNIIVTAMDAKPNYLQNTILSGNIVHNKNNENPANFILRLKSLNKALPNDDLARSSKTSIRNTEPEVKKKFSVRDSNGTELTDAQAEYFRDSKVRDVEGNLLVMYHGTKNGDFTVFDRTQAARKSGFAVYGRGNYFTVFEEGAKNYGKRVVSAYLNIKNPLLTTAHRGAFVSDVAEALGINADEVSTQTVSTNLKKAGYDGVIVRGIGEDEGRIVIAVTYDSAQIKNTDNQKPTDNPDIRYSQRDPLQEKALKALQKENAQLKGDVSRLRELVKLQGKVTNGTRFKRSSVEAAAMYLKKLFHTGGDTKELVDKLKDFYEYMASESELTLETVQEHAAPIIEWLQKNEKFQRSQYAQEVLDTLKGQSFYLDEAQQQEAISQYGNLANYRRAVKNMANSKAGQSLDQLWHELSGQYPDIFRPDTNASDMPLMFADALDMLENLEDTETSADWMMKDQTMLEELLDSFWRVDRLATVADRYEKKINELRWKHEQQMKQLRSDRNSALAELREDKKAAVATVRDNQDRAAIRGKIRKTMRKLDMLLKSETKEKHVPDSMKKAVADALSLMNDIEIGTAEKRMSALQHEIRNLKRKLEQAEGLGDRELTEEFRAQLDEKELALQRYEKSGGRLTALRDAYADISNSADPDIAAGYDAEVAGALAELVDSIKDTSFQDMSREQLQDVLDMYTMVLTRIRDANKQLGARRGETLQENAAETEVDIRKFGISEKDPGVVADKLGKLVRGFSWNNLRPVDAFHRLGSRKLEQLYMDLVDGMAQRGRQIKEIGQFITDVRKKTGYKSFDLKEAETYTTVDGKEMKLTLAEKMSIYAYSKRDQAYDHMAEGGFTYAKDLTYKEKGKTKVHTGKAKTWRLSMEDLQTICGSLTEKQRQYVDEVQQFLTEFGIHGDKVNMELYGIKLFNKEKAYFPLQSDRDYRKSVENQLGGTMTAASLKSDGMTKKTVPGANNPIVLEDFDRVVFRHLDKMANYANLVLPLENLRRVFDYQTSASENQAPASMKALIGATFGREAQQYVEQFLTDANGTRMSMGVQNPLEIMFTRSKGMAVAANLSVMIQQISAVVRAGAEISPKHLMWAAENRKGVKLYDEMVEYAPIAIIKDMGGFDTGSNRSLEDYIGFEEAPNSAKKVWNSMQKLFGMGAETMDKVGWCLIWNGVKREVASRKQYEVNSEEYLQECGRRFTEVIVKTQVYDSVLSRSGYMRDKHGTMRYLTSFMGEPTVQAGMVFNSHLDVVRAIQHKKNIRYSVMKLVRTDAALVGAMVVNGMLKAIPYAMRDDDEDEGYWERWAKQFGSALSELWKPWELLPILRNIDDLASGRTIEQPDMALLSDLLQVGTKVIHVMQDEETMADMKPDDWYALAKELAGSVGNLLGVPVKNIWRDVEGCVRTWKDATDGIDSDGMLLDALWRGIKGEEKTKHEGIYDAMVRGDTARLDALKSTYKTDSSYESAVRKALRLHDPRIKEMANARYESDYDRLEALSYEIEAEGIFDMSTIRAAYEAERTAQAKDRGITLEEDSAAEQAEESTVFSMEEYYAAIRNGSKDSIQTAYNALIEEKKQEYYMEREAEDSIASSVTSKVKGEYLDEDISRADAKSILTKYGGKSKAEAETEIKKWEFQMEYHYAWGSRDRCYRSGTITRSQLVSAVMDIEDASREEAQEYVDFLELEMQNEKVDITASEASSYFEHAKPHGISVEVYLDYKARTKGIQNDKDANGDSIPYTAVQKIMTEIDKLPISSNQKYALARSNGWAEKTIQKYKKW